MVSQYRRRGTEGTCAINVRQLCQRRRETGRDRFVRTLRHLEIEPQRLRSRLGGPARGRLGQSVAPSQVVCEASRRRGEECSMNSEWHQGTRPAERRLPRAGDRLASRAPEAVRLPSDSSGAPAGDGEPAREAPGGHHRRVSGHCRGDRPGPTAAAAENDPRHRSRHRRVHQLPASRVPPPGDDRRWVLGDLEGLFLLPVQPDDAQDAGGRY